MIIKIPLMTKNYRAALYSKFDILDHFEVKYFDQDWPSLEVYLRSIKLDYYTSKQKYIVEHVDTDYYHPDFKYGFWITNLISVFRQVDIPLHCLLLFTNHFGIEREIQSLAPDPMDRPLVVSSFIVSSHYSDNYQSVDTDADAIDYPAICMMGSSRTHRHALFRFLQHNQLLDKVAVSINNT